MSTEGKSGKTHNLRKAALIAPLAVIAAYTIPAMAQDAAPPLVEGKIVFELQNDHAFDSDDPGAEINDLYTTIEAGIGFNLTPVFSVQSSLVLEPVIDPQPFDDRYFEDEGLFVEELYAQAQFDGFRFFAGKYNASFGIAWDKAPGIYGVDFAEDYELAERVGAGFAATAMGTFAGDLTVTGNIFFADTSVLSESIFKNRGRNRLIAGGASNTEALDSFSVTIDGENVPMLPGWTYHLGLRHQAAGLGDAGDEEGFVAALQKTFMLAHDLALQTLVEGVYLDNAFGGPDDVVYLTTSGALLHGPWNLSTSFTLRDTDVAGGPDVHDRLFQISGGYTFSFGLTADAGYRYAREGGIETHIFGLLFTYEYDIGKGLSHLAGG